MIKQFLILKHLNISKSYKNGKMHNTATHLHKMLSFHQYKLSKFIQMKRTLDLKKFCINQQKTENASD